MVSCAAWSLRKALKDRWKPSFWRSRLGQAITATTRPRATSGSTSFIAPTKRV